MKLLNFEALLILHLVTYVGRFSFWYNLPRLPYKMHQVLRGKFPYILQNMLKKYLKCYFNFIFKAQIVTNRA